MFSLDELSWSLIIRVATHETKECPFITSFIPTLLLFYYQKSFVADAINGICHLIRYDKLAMTLPFSLEHRNDKLKGEILTMGNQFKDLQTLYGETELINPKVDGAANIKNRARPFSIYLFSHVICTSLCDWLYCGRQPRTTIWWFLQRTTICDSMLFTSFREQFYDHWRIVRGKMTEVAKSGQWSIGIDEKKVNWFSLKRPFGSGTVN